MFSDEALLLSQERDALISPKERYGKKFALSASQVRFLGELTEAQLAEVKNFFSAGLVNCDQYVYAVKKCDGKLVWARARRDMAMERHALRFAPDRRKRGG